MRIVFLGTGEIGVPTLRALAGWGEVVAVFTQPDRPAGRDLKLRPPPVKIAAQALDLPIFQPEKIRTPAVVTELEMLRADVFVVAAYGQILPRKILDIPRLGCLNVHASLLPRHRGASPIHAAILAGDTESGITIMRMDEGLDTGAMLRVACTPLAPDETAGSLHDRLGIMAVQPLREVLDDLQSGPVAEEAQDERLATYAPKLTRQNGRVDWTTSAGEIDRRIRGMTPWPGAWTVFPDGEVLKIHRAVLEVSVGGTPGEVMEASARGLLVAAGRGALRLLEIQAAGGKRLAAADFLRGRTVPPGLRFG